MARKKKCPPKGAPEWMLTYGDMMTLLLCFFIIIVALSEIKREDEFRATVKEVQKAFGTKGGGGTMPTRLDPELSVLQRIEFLQMQRQRQPQLSEAQDPSIVDRHERVTQIRDNWFLVEGGVITFEQGSADLNERSRGQLRGVAARLRGKNNVIVLRGHASPLEAEEGAEFDLRALSYHRARAVMKYLIGEDCELRPERFWLVDNGDHAPQASRVYSEREHQPNRRVEVFESDALVQDHQRPVTN